LQSAEIFITTAIRVRWVHHAPSAAGRRRARGRTRFLNGRAALRSAGARDRRRSTVKDSMLPGRWSSRRGAACVQTDAQFPLSVTMSPPRRIALLKWAADA
jgi:hypothetical protein